MTDPLAHDPFLAAWRNRLCGAGSDAVPVTKDDAAIMLDRVCAAESALSDERAKREEAERTIYEVRCGTQSAESALAAARAEVERIRQAYWDGRAILGFDNDGDPTPKAIVSDFAALILSDCREERASLDEARAETDAAEARVSTLTDALEQANRERDEAARLLADHSAHAVLVLRERDSLRQALADLRAPHHTVPDAPPCSCPFCTIINRALASPSGAAAPRSLSVPNGAGFIEILPGPTGDPTVRAAPAAGDARGEILGMPVKVDPSLPDGSFRLVPPPKLPAAAPVESGAAPEREE